MIKILQLFVLLFGFLTYSQSQSVSLFKQYTGQYDFFMMGNTMNSAPNGTNAPCTILTQSSAMLNLNTTQEVQAAFLYWSGSGDLSQADLDVKLNGTPIRAERTFTANGPTGLPFFSAFADVSSLVKATGNVLYTLSDLDLTAIIAPYCPTGSNYAGWSMVIVYEDPFLPNRVVSIYEGFELVDHTGSKVAITLNGLNVTNLNNAKVGFLAWEGDENLAVTEELRINNQIIGNPPLNPINNAFNCTNTFTGATNLWNMDIDYYQIGNYLSLGDTEMTVEIQTGQDLVIINNILVALSSLFADATITIDDVTVSCDNREIHVEYTVYNSNGTGKLVANVPINFYANNELVGSTATKAMIPIGGSETGSILLTIPETIPENFILSSKVDDDGTVNGTVVEVDETNNSANKIVQLIISPQANKPTDMILCDYDEDGYVVFNLTPKLQEVTNSSNVAITLHESESDAQNGINQLTNIAYYELKTYKSNTIWVRVEYQSNGCSAFTSFRLTAQMKPFTELKDPLMICNYKDNPRQVNLGIASILLKRMFDYADLVQLQFYETKSDAENQINEINNIQKYEPPRFPYIVWIKATGTNRLLCDHVIPIQVNDCVVPKGISPNGDGFNDGFNLEIFNLIDLKIYNRYGNLVYEHGVGYIDQWKGQDRNNRELPSGTYFYLFKTSFDTYSGWVYLMKELP